MGKAYANRKQKKDRPVGDFYETPYSLVWKLIETGELDKFDRIVDPCCGKGAILHALKNHPRTQNKEIVGFDKESYKDTCAQGDLFEYRQHEEAVVTNFPFSDWDRCVQHAITFADTVITIGRVNYFGTHDRHASGRWAYLQKVYVFDRMVDYRGPIREDGFFHVGALVTGWFVFKKNKTFTSHISVIDVQEYAKLGAVK